MHKKNKKIYYLQSKLETAGFMERGLASEPQKNETLLSRV